MRYPDGGGLTAKQQSQREMVRMAAAELFEQGMPPPQVAQLLRVSDKSAYVWHQRWQTNGVEGLRSVGPTGRRPRMKPQWLAWLDEQLQRGPAAHGWIEDQRWTVARISTMIARRFHIRMSIPQTWRILRQMGWSAQVPAHRAAERDEDAIATWIKEVWPEVEKPRRTRTRGSSSPTNPASRSVRPRHVPGPAKATPRSLP
jgi:putative transposase